MTDDCGFDGAGAVTGNGGEDELDDEIPLVHGLSSRRVSLNDGNPPHVSLGGAVSPLCELGSREFTDDSPLEGPGVAKQ